MISRTTSQIIETDFIFTRERELIIYFYACIISSSFYWRTINIRRFLGFYMIVNSDIFKIIIKFPASDILPTNPVIIKLSPR